MRSKLQKFTEFAGSLLPHETEFLLHSQRFEDEVKLGILERVNDNSHRLRDGEIYDEEIDKRKYSHLKNWVVERLDAIDVDQQFNWMCEMEKRIMTDNIDPAEEKVLLKKIREFSLPVFYFTKFYELVETYRHFLLIRLRYDDHRLVDEFLKDYQQAYQRSKQISEQIHTATADIINQFATTETGETRQWEDWLIDVFYDDTLDGLNRYLALVRLTFLYLNYRKLDQLRDKYDYLDNQFRQGQYYSKRLLLNYYHNRMLLHTKCREYDQAIYYGYLSIRQKNNDYLLYVNNLSGVLLRQRRVEDAMEVLRTALPDMKSSKNYFNKIGYVSFYVHTLNLSGKARSAENYAEAFLQAYRQEIIKYRWHLFFSAYLQSLLMQEKYAKALRTIRKFKLLEREKRYRKHAGHLPIILWYQMICEYKEGMLTRQQLQLRIQQQLRESAEDGDKQTNLKDLLREIRNYVPDILRGLEENSISMLVAAG
jgi:hypothetical protein